MNTKSTYLLFFILSFAGSAFAQSMLGPATVANYSIAQKRLLLNNTLQFVNWKSMNNLDADSAMSIARSVTHLPFLLPYTEGFNDFQPISAKLINAGKITGAKQLLKIFEGERRMQLLVELGIWYLHQSGKHTADLDSAEHYIKLAAFMSSSMNDRNLLFSFQMLFAELNDQRGNRDASINIYAQILSLSEKEGNLQMTAIASQQLGILLPANDSMKFIYFTKALRLYQQLNLKEKEIEQLSDIADYYLNTNKALMLKYLLRMLALQKAMGFKHVLFTEYRVTFAYLYLNNNLAVLDHINAGNANIKWSGLSQVEPSFLVRMGAAYEGLGKNTEAMGCYRKAMSSRYSSPELFWYAGFFYAATLLAVADQVACLSLIDSITKEFPPISTCDKMALFTIKGQCYAALQNHKLADENYRSFYKLIIQYPEKDPYLFYRQRLQEIAAYYVSQKNLKTALLFLDVEFSDPATVKDDLMLYQRYSVLYKIDSIRGDYGSALQNHIKYKYYFDAYTNIDQRKKFDEITVKYAAAKKDQDIELLKQQGIAQQSELKQNKLTRNITIGGVVLLLFIIALLLNQYVVKQRTNKAINKKNAALNKLVSEKEWLLKEVHHRVKNNLQTVVSLLELQSENLKDEALSAIQQSQDRVYAMSLIHQKLYQSHNVASINVAPYLQELIGHLREIYNVGPAINIQCYVDAIEMDVSQAIPVGLIVNEAVTNSIKYAFYQVVENPAIMISLINKNNNQMKLIIADNGTGLPPDFINEPKDGLGFRLMEGLAEDIEGEFTNESVNGTQISVCFNASVPFHEANKVMPTKQTVAA